MPIFTLAQILRENLPADTEVDLLNVDCEGMDLDVLAGNDWKQCQPKVICAEAKTSLEEKKLTDFLRQKGYIPHARVFYSLIFLRKDWGKRQFPELAATLASA